jgi:hypothetical protein
VRKRIRRGVKSAELITFRVKVRFSKPMEGRLLTGSSGDANQFP